MEDLSIRIETDNIGKKGLQRITGYVGDDDVIELNDAIFGFGWRVAMSRTLGGAGISTIKSEAIVKCFKMAFEKMHELKEIEKV